MPLPANVTTVSLHAKILRTDAAGTPARGRVSFGVPFPLRDPAGNVILGPVKYGAELDVNGEFTLALPATDDPDITPIGWTYRVAVDTDAWVEAFDIEVPVAAAGTGLELADIAPVVTPTAVVTYALASHVHGGGSSSPADVVVSETAFGQAAAAGVSSAYSRGDHTHGTPTTPAADPRAAKFGLELVTMDSAVPVNRFDLTAGTVVFLLAHCMRSRTLGHLGTWVAGVGATPNGNENSMAIFSLAGTRLGVTGSFATVFTALGWAEVALGATVDVVAGTTYYLALLANMTTPPKIACGPQITGADRLAVNGIRPAVFLTGQTTMPASFTPGSTAVNSAEHFLGAR